MPAPRHALASITPQTPTTPPTSHDLVIQNAIAADADAIANLGAATFAANFGHSVPAEHLQSYLEEAYSPAAIVKDLADEKNQFFVARTAAGEEGKGQVVGFIQIKLATTEPCVPTDVPMCELHRIYVSLEYIGGGTGQLLMERGIQWAREHLLGSKLMGRDGDVGDGGVEEEKHRAGIWLGVWEENGKAVRFYQRWGFVQVGSHDFVTGNTRQTDWVMVKWL